MGLPGAKGSVDVTHVPIGRPPEQLRHNLIGKEKKATYGYQAVVLHCGRLLAACGGFPGATNDKTIVRLDPAVLRVRDGALYKSIPFELLDEDGQPFKLHGVWILCDNGYHKVSVSGPHSAYACYKLSVSLLQACCTDSGADHTALLCLPAVPCSGA